MLFLRLLGKFLLLIAFAALTYDGARTLATPGRGIAFTSLGGYLQTYSPASLTWLQDSFGGKGASVLWHSLLEPMLIIPLSILFSIFGTLIFLAGYRRPPPEILRE
jgi:hypothetical protein